MSRTKTEKRIIDQEKVITHLQILRTWASFAKDRDINFFTSKHFEDMTEWIDDTIYVLKENGGENKMNEESAMMLAHFCREYLKQEKNAITMVIPRDILRSIYEIAKEKANKQQT